MNDYIKAVLDDPRYQEKILVFVRDLVQNHPNIAGQANPYILKLEVSDSFREFWPNWKLAGHLRG